MTCYRQKIDRLDRNIDFVQRNTSKSPILVCTNLGYLTLGGPGRQTVDTRSKSGLPLKTLGYTCYNAHNLALKTPYPPFPYIFWTLWTWGFTRYHLMYTIPIKNWANHDEATSFLGYFWWLLWSGAQIIWRNQRFSKFESFGWFLRITSLCLS